MRILFSLCLAALTAIGCAQTPATQKIYEAAIKDAANPLPAKIDDQLFAVNSSNEQLQWKAFNKVQYVKVVSYIAASDTIYYPRDQWATYRFGSYGPWVTLAPQLKTTCSAAGFGKKEGLPLRLNQLIGLPPEDQKGWVMEFYIRPVDLFRPCADADIDDQSCGLSIPTNVSEDHLIWYNNIRATQYYPSKGEGYPWSQLGYTYDWNPENESHIGLSEYVVQPGAPAVIVNLVTAKDYCKQSK